MQVCARGNVLRDKGAREVLVYSPHYHVLGFIAGGYRCRDCERKWDCLKGCGGWDDRSWQQYARDKYYVKVLAERKTVFGSAYYELNHSTLRIGMKRFHVYSWGGRLGNSTFKSKRAKPVTEDKCPICLGEMQKAVYVGKRQFAKDIGDVEYRTWFLVHRSEEDDFLCYDEMGEGRGGREMRRSRRCEYG